MPEARTLEVEADEAGSRLDVFLAQRLAVSRAEARRLLARGAVQIGERALRAGDKGLALRAGECVEVSDVTRPEQQRVLPEPDAPLSLLAEGPGWLVVDKPAGMAVHPLAPEERGSVLGAVVARHPEIAGIGEGALRSGVVHRLDVDTSGALLFASEEASWQRLREAFRRHRVAKRYRAIAHGVLESDGEIELALVTARHRPAYVREAREREREGARSTHTRWRVLERFAAATLLEVETRTGHLHQVRATLAHLGHPLLGDRSYAEAVGIAGAEVAAAAPRHLLHAASLAFEEIAAESPDPADFVAVLDALRGAG